MKSVTLHPLSVLVGLVLSTVLVLMAGAQGTRDKFPLPTEVHFVGIPDPAQFIEVREEDSLFSVPAGKRFVLVWSWTERTNGAGNTQDTVLLRDGADTLFLGTSGTDWSCRVFLDGPRTFRVNDLNNISTVLARLVGYFVPIE